MSRASGSQLRDADALTIAFENMGKTTPSEANFLESVQQSIDLRFPRMDQSLRQYLALMVDLRRKRLKYARTHRNGHGSVEDKSPELVQRTKHSTTPLRNAGLLESQSGDTLLKSQHPSMTFDSHQTQEDLERAPFFTATFPLSRPLHNRYHPDLPGPPFIDDYQTEHQCVFCGWILPVEECSGQRWTNHVLHDLEPFICLDKACLPAQTAFARMEDWVTHTYQEHTRLWKCPLDHPEAETDTGQDLLFSRQVDLNQHLISEHKLSSSTARTIARRSAISDPSRIFKICPFCKWLPNTTSSDIDASKVYDQTVEAHTANHLVSLSSMALSKRDDIEIQESKVSSLQIHEETALALKDHHVEQISAPQVETAPAQALLEDDYPPQSTADHDPNIFTPDIVAKTGQRDVAVNSGDVKTTRRVKYTKLEDIQIVAAMMRNLEVHRIHPSNRPNFLIHGRIYSVHEIARRVQRAKKSGTWTQESLGTIPQPGHIQIIPARTSTTPNDQCSTGNSQGSRVTIPSMLMIDRNGRVNNLLRYCSHQSAMHDPVRMFTTPSDPDALKKTAELCFNISRYLKGAHDKGLFIGNDRGELVSRTSAQSLTNLNNLYKYCIVAIDLWDRRYWSQGTALLSRAMKLIEVVLDEQDPKMLDVLCDLCVLLPTRGFGQLYEILRHKMCSIVKYRAWKENELQHPWAKIFACVGRLSSAEVAATMQQIWKCGYDHITELRPEDPWDAINISCHSAYELRMGENAQHHWDILLTRLTQLKHSDASEVQRQFACGKIFHLQGNHRGALKIMQHILLQCEQASKEGESKWKPMEIEALEVSARCHYAIHKTTPSPLESATAQDLLDEAIEKSVELHGVQSATTIALQHTLWLWFIEQGRDDEADLLRKTIDHAMSGHKAPEPSRAEQPNTMSRKRKRINSEVSAAKRVKVGD